jgi:L-fuconolactonase
MATAPPPVRAPRIDTHQHFWRYEASRFPWIDARKSRLERDFLPDDLEPLLRQARIDACVAVQARDHIDETAFLLDLAAHNHRIAGVVGWFDLQADDVREQLAGWTKHPGLVGVRHIVHDEPDDRFMLRPAFLRGLSALAEFGLTYDLLLFPRHLPVAVEVVAQLPQLRFVVDHLAKPAIRDREIDGWASGIARLAAFPNVYAKLSGLVTEANWHTWRPEDLRPYLQVALELFGPKRLMIGSDWPVCTLAGDYAAVMAPVIEFAEEQSEAHRDAILGGNAMEFWSLKTEVRQPGPRQA